MKNNTEKTVREWFEELPDGSFKANCIKSIDTEWVGYKEYPKSLSGAIKIFADWPKTKRGNDYWTGAFRAIEALEQMPKQVHEYEYKQKVIVWGAVGEFEGEYYGITPDGRVIVGVVDDDDLRLYVWDHARPIKSTVTVTIDGESFEIDPELAEQIRKGVKP